MQSKPTPSAFSATTAAWSPTSVRASLAPLGSDMETSLWPRVPDLVESESEADETESEEDDSETEERKVYGPRGGPVDICLLIDPADTMNHEFPAFEEQYNWPIGHTHQDVDEEFAAFNFHHGRPDNTFLQLQLDNTSSHAPSAAARSFDTNMPDLEYSYNPYRDNHISKL